MFTTLVSQVTTLSVRAASKGLLFGNTVLRKGQILADNNS